MKRQIVALLVIAMLAMVSCTSDIVSVDIPQAAQIGGTWQGTAHWSALQGGGSIGSNSTGTATATLFQNDAAILAGSSWDVTGIFTGTMTGAIGPDGNATGAINVLVLSGGCSATASWGGTVNGNTLTISASFSAPGSIPCPGAPVGLVLNLSR